MKFQPAITLIALLLAEFFDPVLARDVSLRNSIDSTDRQLKMGGRKKNQSSSSSSKRKMGSSMGSSSSGGKGDGSPSPGKGMMSMMKKRSSKKSNGNDLSAMFAFVSTTDSSGRRLQHVRSLFDDNLNKLSETIVNFYESIFNDMGLEFVYFRIRDRDIEGSIEQSLRIVYEARIRVPVDSTLTSDENFEELLLRVGSNDVYRDALLNEINDLGSAFDDITSIAIIDSEAEMVPTQSPVSTQFFMAQLSLTTTIVNNDSRRLVQSTRHLQTGEDLSALLVTVEPFYKSKLEDEVSGFIDLDLRTVFSDTMGSVVTVVYEARIEVEGGSENVNSDQDFVNLLVLSGAETTELDLDVSSLTGTIFEDSSGLTAQSDTLTETPTSSPTSQPTDRTTSMLNTLSPSSGPTFPPTISPTGNPTMPPTASPSVGPTPGTAVPTTSPSVSPMTQSPTGNPTSSPSFPATGQPTRVPSSQTNTNRPTVTPTISPSVSPTSEPTSSPTVSPTAAPTESPVPGASASPTGGPTSSPSQAPVPGASASPTAGPTSSPSQAPVPGASASPTVGPTNSPTSTPTTSPTSTPTSAPTGSTLSPTSAPTFGTGTPTSSPTSAPTSSPSQAPVPSASASPTVGPTDSPTSTPTTSPTSTQTSAPTGSATELV